LKKKVLLSIAFAVIITLLISAVALAEDDDFEPDWGKYEYRYSGTSFWYIGQFQHEKDFRHIQGDVHFDVEGRGEARGSQHIHAVSESKSPWEYSHRLNASTYLWGRTADDATAMDLKASEDEALDHIKDERQAAIDALNAQFRDDPNMSAADYEAALESIREEYEEKRLAIKREFDAVKNNVKLVSQKSALEGTAYETNLTSGVNMDPGETGYIKQNVAANRDQDGEYMRLRNEVENTGGVTINDLEIGDYLNESLRVEGYAKVRQSATVDSGGARTGWWNTGR